MRNLYAKKKGIGNLLGDFILSRIADDREGLGSCAKGLLALEERGKWENERAANIMEVLVLLHRFTYWVRYVLTLIGLSTTPIRCDSTNNRARDILF